MFSFQNAWPIKRKAVYTLVLTFPYMFIHFPFDNRIGSQLPFLRFIFFKIFETFKWLLVVRSVASGGKVYRLPSDKENTAVHLFL